MKVCIPAVEEKGLDGMPHGHFGSATHFVIHDTDTGATDIIRNSNQAHEHGMCHPLAALDGRGIQAIVVGGIGFRALSKLQAGGMRVYRSAPRSSWTTRRGRSASSCAPAQTPRNRTG
jgi:predicted Fe-Mo cluster-binding NifX family protein